MERRPEIRWGALKILYVYTAAGAGLLGGTMLVAPAWVTSTFKLPVQDPVVFSIAGSLYTAFGILALFGVRYPLQFVPILLLQMTYKTIWVAWFLVHPPFASGPAFYGPVVLGFFLTYIAGDLYAIPFREFFGAHRRDRDA